MDYIASANKVAAMYTSSCVNSQHTEETFERFNCVMSLVDTLVRGQITGHELSTYFEAPHMNDQVMFLGWECWQACVGYRALVDERWL